MISKIIYCIFKHLDAEFTMTLEFPFLKWTLLCWARLIFGGSQFTGCSKQAATISQRQAGPVQ